MDILNERRLSITAAAKELGISTVCAWRWALYRGGIKLESQLIGGKRFTSIERIEAFVTPKARWSYRPWLHAVGDRPLATPTLIVTSFD